MAAMQNEAAAEAMADDGVVPESLVILIEATGLTMAGRELAPVCDCSEQLCAHDVRRAG